MVCDLSVVWIVRFSRLYLGWWFALLHAGGFALLIGCGAWYADLVCLGGCGLSFVGWFGVASSLGELLLRWWWF